MNFTFLTMDVGLRSFIDYHLLDCYTMYFCRWLLSFQRNILPSSSFFTPQMNMNHIYTDLKTSDTKIYCTLAIRSGTYFFKWTLTSCFIDGAVDLKKRVKTVQFNCINDAYQWLTTAFNGRGSTAVNTDINRTPWVHCSKQDKEVLRSLFD
jgi:hypothetical protein